MRFYLKRLVIFISFILCTTIVLFSIPQNGSEQEWNSRENPRKPVPRFLRSFNATSRLSKSLENKFEDVGNNFRDLYFDELLMKRLMTIVSSYDMDRMIALECPLNETLKQYWLRKREKVVPQRDSWERFYANIGTCDLYRDDKIIDELLHDLKTLPIKNVAIMDGGTQVKLVLTFENNEQAVLKPMRFGRDYETNPNHFYFSDFERHHAEIATFHLDKILGFRRAVPTVGRVFNMSSELKDKSERVLERTFFISPAKNLCFVSKCDYYCDTTHAICGSPDMKEASVQAFLPDERSVPRKNNKSPYRRTYSKRNQVADWQKDMNFCSKYVKIRKQYSTGRKLIDLVDLHILDFLIGNLDRHHFETFVAFDNLPSYPIHLDNGRAFGRTDIDYDDILFPLKQCCVIRPSTLRTLINFYGGPVSLTNALHKSLSSDPIAPILAIKHYPAMERRLHKIMVAIEECILKQANGISDVVMAEYQNSDNTDNLDKEATKEEDEEEKNDEQLNRKNYETVKKIET